MDMKVGLSSEYDISITKSLADLASLRPFDEVSQAFPAYIRRQNISRFLAYYELFKKIQHMPGWIVECGIYRGFSFFTLGKLLEIFCMGDKTRKLIGFDNFSGFTPLHPKDGSEDPSCTRHEGGTNPCDFRDEFFQLLDLANQDCFAPWAKRMLVIEGDVRTTIPKYCQDNAGLRLSMLHIDIDIYEPVRISLENLYPRLLPGGILVLDEFAHKDWPGESQAVKDVFLENNWKLPEFHSFNWIGTPTTYCLKEEW